MKIINLKKERGITLISLIVIIIILVVLARISYGIVKNSGIINKSKKIANQYIDKSENENAFFYNIYEYAQKIENENNKIDDKNNIEYIDKTFEVNIISVSGGETTNANVKLKIKYDDGLICNAKICKINDSKGTKNEEIIYSDYPYKNEIEVDLNYLIDKDYKIYLINSDKTLMEKTIKFGFTDCNNEYLAKEGDTVTLDEGYWYIKYGLYSSFNYRWATGTLGINNDYFGDPYVGKNKEAYKVRKIDLYVNNSVSKIINESELLKLIDVDASFNSFNGTNAIINVNAKIPLNINCVEIINKGDNSVYYKEDNINSIIYNKDLSMNIGKYDMIFYYKYNGQNKKVHKNIEIILENVNPNRWLASENSSVSISKGESWLVKYGAYSSFYYRWATNSIYFGNSVFGDPCYGTIKSGYLVQKCYMTQEDFIM